MPSENDIIAGKIKLVKEIGFGGQGTVWAGIDYSINIEMREIESFNEFKSPNTTTEAGKYYYAKQLENAVIGKPKASTTINCAVKFLERRGDSAKTRFNDEFRAASMLNDPRILRVLDYDNLDNTNPAIGPWIEMEYISGGNLKNRVKSLNDPPEISNALKMFKEIVMGVNVAHSNHPRILHRDLKPENILFKGDGTPVISDFGLCFIDEESRVGITRASEDVGPRHFMAPELEGSFPGPPSPASDIYSLGKILYYILSNGVILPRENYDQEMFDLRGHGKTSEQIEYIYNLLFVNTIVLEPEHRYQNCGELIEDVDKLILITSEHFYPVRHGRKCIICGEGYYEGKRHNEIRGEAYRMICNKCGNIQLFSKDLSLG